MVNIADSTYYYDFTQQMIDDRCDNIITASLAHLSFDLIDLDYDIYLCYKDKDIKIEPGMQLYQDGSACKEIKRGHDIFKMFRAGVFNEILGINDVVTYKHLGVIRINTELIMDHEQTVNMAKELKK